MSQENLDDLDISSLKSSSPVVEVPNSEEICIICDARLKQPRVLTCLHVFCTDCIRQLLVNISDDIITCPKCRQPCRVPAGNVENLHLDYVTINLMDIAAIELKQVVCTSCKAKETAVARCMDCANFLCSNCVTAHQYMRCFENHKVLKFTEVNSSDELAVHKPVFCTNHCNETVKYFCTTCQIPICNDCMLTCHKQPSHVYERMSDISEKQQTLLRDLVTEAKLKTGQLDEATEALQNKLSELQLQRDNAKDLIQETFQSYKVMLETRKDTLLQELEDIHSNMELSIMEEMHKVEKVVENMNDAFEFTERTLDHGNNVEILSLKKVASSQLQRLIQYQAREDIAVDIVFRSDAKEFQQSIEASFGALAAMAPVQAEAAVVEPTASQPHMFSGSLENLMSMATALTSHTEVTSHSHSPAMSDSGISMDGAASNPHHLPDLPRLAKLSSVGVDGNAFDAIPGISIGDSTFSQALNVVTSQSNFSSNALRDCIGASTELQALEMLASANGGIGASALGTAGIGAAGLGTALSAASAIGGTAGLGASAIGGPASLATAAGIGTAAIEQSVNALMLNAAATATRPSLPSPSSDLVAPDDLSPAGTPSFLKRGAVRMTAMQIRCKFGQLGPVKGQFNSPHGFTLGLEEDIVVADTNNHRIQIFEKSGEFKYQFGIPGREEGQLWYPRKVAILRNSGKYIVCDRGNERSRMQIFTKNGHFIRKIAIRYIDIVAGLAVTHAGHIVAVDSVSPTVFVIAETGDLVKWFDCSDYMREPSDIAVSGHEFFVCDFKGHCVVVFSDDGSFLRRIGCEGITNFPNGIDISDAGDVLIGDSHGNRFHVAVFQRDGSLISEFECPYVKVSRCCGLKITSEGYVVTLAKNNHHVLVLNTLYIA